jgi:hypothetical protein
VDQVKAYEQGGILMAEHQDHMKDVFDTVIKIKDRTARESSNNARRAKEKCTREHGIVLSKQIDL